MYEAINRFKEHPNFERHLDELFGCPEWRQGMDLTHAGERKEFFYDLYKAQLKKNGAQHVVDYELYEDQRLVYAIFFGTGSLEGCDKMKQAIWKVAPFGDFKFRGSQLGQMILGSTGVDFSPLERTLQEHFRSKGWIAVRDVEDFVKSDAMDFHSGHLKRSTLKPMEANGKIEVQPGTRKKSGTYPKGTVLRFL